MQKILLDIERNKQKIAQGELSSDDDQSDSDEYEEQM